uniref:Putative secreted peptide n=1 Tax=Anopheles braziliensis TaxID=58242 RepID=A0A2M3ZQY7_9DIPT
MLDLLHCVFACVLILLHSAARPRTYLLNSTFLICIISNLSLSSHFVAKSVLLIIVVISNVINIIISRSSSSLYLFLTLLHCFFCSPFASYSLRLCRMLPLRSLATV